MSSDEEVYTESEEETIPETPTRRKVDKDPEFVKRQEAKSSVFDEQLKDYIVEWRKQKTKEEDDLRRLKEKQAKRKVMRAEEEKRMAARKKQEEERRLREAEERRQREIEEKRRRLEEAEKKRQAMMAALKAQDKAKGRNFIITKKDNGTDVISPVQIERSKTKEQLEEEKRISLSYRVKPLHIEGLAIPKLQSKARELWDCIVKLETEKYDLEERQRRQEYDLKELKERQKQQLRQKALKKGLDPQALSGKHPPKIQVASKYERRVDTKSYDDKKKIFDGGYMEANKVNREKTWAERIGQFENRPKAKLPKWFGERPGKKRDDPETPEDEEAKKDDEVYVPSSNYKTYDEEEEEEVEEEEEYEEEEESEEEE